MTPRWQEVWIEAAARAQRRNRRKKSENTQISKEKIISNNVKRSKKLMSLGEISNAARALMSFGVASPNKSVVDALSKKHPQQKEVIPQEFRGERMVASESVVRAMALRFNRSSSGGLDGVTAQHFLDFMAESSATDILKVTTDFVNLVLGGRTAAVARPFFFGARLIAINKKDGGVRPIAVGNILRRLSGKVLVKMMEKEALSFCGARQVGIGTSGGCEIMASSFSKFIRYTGNNTEKCTLKIDFVNAFNMCSREKFLSFVFDEFPPLYPFVVSMIANHSILRCSDGTVIYSAAGFQQGCPASPMFFSLLLEYFLRENVSELDSLEFVGFYLDDGSIGGSTTDVGKVFDLIVEKGEEYGLVVNKKKCVLVVDEEKLEEVKWSKELSIITNGNVDIVGVPIGSPDFVNSYFKEQLDELEIFCQRLRLLNDPQFAFLLLSKHGSICKVNYIMRTVPPSQIRASLQRYDNMIRSTMEWIVGHPLSESQYSQMSLSFRHGGMGMRNATNSSCAAYLSSEALVSKSDVQLLRGNALQFYDIQAEHVKMENIQLFNAQVHPSKCIDEDTPPHDLTQFTLVDAIERSVFSKLLSDASPRDKAHLLGSSARKSYGFLRAVPNAWEGGKLDPMQFRIACQIKLRINLTEREQRCLACGSPLDKLGDHGLVCSSGTGRIQRHDKVTVAISKLLHEAKQEHALELSHLTGDNKERPGDIFIPQWSGGKDLAVDVGVVCPTAPSYRSNASKERFYSANQMYARKESKYDKICAEKGFNYLPVVFETPGGVCGKSKDFFNILADRLASASCEEIPRAKHRIFTRISIALQRSNVIAILNHYKLH